jgi:hypothetical protein
VAVYAMRRPRGSLVGEAPEAFEGGAPPPEDGVHRVLLVADSACTTSDLEQLADGNTTVFVVVPAVSSRLARWTGDQQPYQDAEERLHATLQALGVLGLEGTGHVGSHDPLQAADEGLREFPAEEIVFALHPDSESEWLEQGVVDLGRGRYPVPVRELERRTDG